MNLKKFFGDFSDVHWKDLDHKKVYTAAAVLLALIILIIVVIAQAFSGKKPEKKENNVINDKTVTENTEEPVEDNPLEIDAHQEVNDVIFKYFHGLSTGDIPLVEDVVDVLTEDEIKTIETKKEYVEAYRHLICYTKKGLEEGSYVAFVSYDMKILNIETLAPGMLPLYLRQDEAGNYYIFNGDASGELESYVLELAAQEDIAAIIADTQARYEEALTQDPALAEFDSRMHESQQPSGEENPTEEPPAEEPTEEVPEEPTEETPEEPAELSEPVSTTVTATIRIRAGRSVDTELISVIASGTGVKVYAHYSDGWSKIEYDGTVGYCKTEYLEAKEGIPTLSVENGAETAEGNDTQTEEPAAEATAINKKMRLKSTVRIREERSADSDRIANGYQGEYVQAIESYSDGWCKVEYNGKTGYCQTQYLEEI